MPIVTDGLIGYWNAKKSGGSGATWQNISPSTHGKYDGTIYGGILTNGYISNDGIDDYISIGAIQAADKGTSFEVEIYFEAPFDNTGGYFGEHMIFTDATSNFSSFSIIDFKGDGSYVWIGSGQGFTINFSKNTVTKINLVVNRTTKLLSLYVNDVLIGSLTANHTISDLSNIVFAGTIGNGYHFKGKIYSVKLYNRALTNAERIQNSVVGTEIGLESDLPPSTPPVTIIISIDRTKVSDEVGMDRSNITFKFDKDVTQWEVRVIGSGQGTGILADSGGSVKANTNIVAEVDWTELYQEGQNKVNIYGKGADGSWTPYNN